MAARDVTKWIFIPNIPVTIDFPFALTCQSFEVQNNHASDKKNNNKGPGIIFSSSRCKETIKILLNKKQKSQESLGPVPLSYLGFSRETTVRPTITEYLRQADARRGLDTLSRPSKLGLLFWIWKVFLLWSFKIYQSFKWKVIRIRDLTLLSLNP